MKKDNLISIGFVISNFSNQFLFEKIKFLHALLNQQYNYFEILIVDNSDMGEIDFEIFQKTKKISLSNIRLIVLQYPVDIEVANTILVENSIGDYLCLFDIEHDPIDKILEMLLSAEDCDVVIGKRIKKEQMFFDKITSYLFYKIINILTSVRVNASYGDFFTINRKVISAITKNSDKMKILKLIKLGSGFVKKEFEYMPVGKKSHQRSILRNINYSIDIIINHSYKMLRVATILSLLTALFNMMYAFYVVAIFVFKAHVAEGWTSTQIYSSFTNFVLFLVLAILGEYIRMIQLHLKDNPTYEIANETSSVVLFSDKKNVDLGE